MADYLISDILKGEYSNFLEYCLNANKRYRSELTGKDYIAYSLQYRIPYTKVVQLCCLIEAYGQTIDTELPRTEVLSMVFPKPDKWNDIAETTDCTAPYENEDAVPVSILYESNITDLSQDEVLSVEKAVQTNGEDDHQTIQGNNTIPFTGFSFASDVPLYQLLCVAWEPFLDMPLLESDIGARAYHSLLAGRKKDGSSLACKTVGDLLKLSPLQLSNYEGMGKLSIERILNALTLTLHSESGKHEKNGFNKIISILRRKIDQLHMMIESCEHPANTEIQGDENYSKVTTEPEKANNVTETTNAIIPYENEDTISVNNLNESKVADLSQGEVISVEKAVQTNGEDDHQTIQGNNTIPFTGFSFASDVPLYQLLCVAWEPFLDMPLLESDIGARAYHSLLVGRKKDGSSLSCKTVGDLLKLSPLQLSKYKGMGKLSIEQIVSALNLMVHSNNSQPEKKVNKSVSFNFGKQVLAMLQGRSPDISSFSYSKTAVFSEYMSAYEAIEKEIVLAAASGNPDVLGVMRMFQKYFEDLLKLYKRELKEKFDVHVRSLSKEIKSLPVKPFIAAYSGREGIGMNQKDYPFSLDSETTVWDFIREIWNDNGDMSEVLNYAFFFVKWMNCDLAALCQPIRECFKSQKENEQFVIEQRMLGETLETIASILGVTRERIRQIEKRVATLMKHSYDVQKSDHDILATIYAFLGGETVLHYEDLATQIGDADAQLIWFLAKKDLINCEAYHFSHQLNAVVFSRESEHVALLSLLSELPAFIEKSEMPHYIADLVEKHGVAEELLRMQLRSTYKRDGMFYHRGRLTVVFMCDYILRTRFPNGYKIADESDHKRFMSYLAEVFENKGKITARALDAKIGQIGVLIDRGKYIHPSYIDVDKKIIDDINAYIENSPRVVLTYTELFDTFSDRFSGTQINNKYCLQGALKLLGCPFVMRKDYITKESDVNLASEFEHFVEQSGRVHKSVLLEEFNGLSEINIGFFCQRLSTIVVLDGGYYMHASQLNINENDYNQQRKFLLTTCSDTPASTRVLYNEYMMRFTDFMIRNNIESQGNLFGVLQYMFRKEFFFSRPYISLSDDIDLTHHGVLLQHLSGFNSIEIEDLIDLCDKNGIRFFSILALMKSIEPDFIRVGKTTLMRKELAGVDDDSVLDTAQQIKEIVHVRGGYCASKNIDDFSWFPELNVPWNAYFLESVSALAGDLLTVLRINTSTVYTPVDIYIGDEFVDEDTNSLIVRLLVKESQLEPFASKEDVFYWLQEQGLCNAKLPSFLETEGHLFYDESGKLKVQ